VTDDTDPATLQRVTERIQTGAVEPTISGVYPLDAGQAALEESAAGHVRGKLVIDIDGTTA